MQKLLGLCLLTLLTLPALAQVDDYYKRTPAPVPSAPQPRQGRFSFWGELKAGGVRTAFRDVSQQPVFSGNSGATLLTLTSYAGAGALSVEWGRTSALQLEFGYLDRRSGFEFSPTPDSTFRVVLQNEYFTLPLLYHYSGQVAGPRSLRFYAQAGLAFHLRLQARYRQTLLEFDPNFSVVLNETANVAPFELGLLLGGGLAVPIVPEFVLLFAELRVLPALTNFNDGIVEANAGPQTITPQLIHFSGQVNVGARFRLY